MEELAKLSLRQQMLIKANQDLANEVRDPELCPSACCAFSVGWRNSLRTITLSTLRSSGPISPSAKPNNVRTISTPVLMITSEHQDDPYRTLLTVTLSNDKAR
eukprot:370252-Prorocentrum_minimum.AAC.2